MSKAAIKIEEVSRKFRLGDGRRPVGAALRRWFHIDRPVGDDSLEPEEFWALRNLSLEVKRGEALALIGPNGAGKSTALKLLAGIMPPTRGNIRVDGRISALIEVGAGFHPDLTGRENIYLNGSVLGMTRRETRRKFDAIVEFAGIGPFLDTPLKRYSSGMYARLGFSVAAHVEPEVLIVDEVLSVGDRVFRARCMDRMREFLKRGVAILFVSHDLATVASFCDRAYVLAVGDTVFHGAAGDAVEHYHRACVSSQKAASGESPHEAPLEVQCIRVLDRNGEPCRSYAGGQRVCVEVDSRIIGGIGEARYQLRVLRTRDLAQAGALQTAPIGQRRAGRWRDRLAFNLNVPPGEYSIRCAPVRAGVTAQPDPFCEERIMVRDQSDAGGLADLCANFAVSPVAG